MISTKLYVVSLFIQSREPIFLRFVIIRFSFLWLAPNTTWLGVAFMRKLDGSNACGLAALDYAVGSCGRILMRVQMSESNTKHSILFSHGIVCACVFLSVCLCVHLIVAGVGK